MSYLGKRIEVKIPKRDEKGKLTKEWQIVRGICQSEPQENKFLGIPLQTVVDRMPVELKSLNDIKIV